MTNNRKTTLCMQMLVYAFYETTFTYEQVKKHLLFFFDDETIKEAKSILANKVGKRADS